MNRELNFSDYLNNDGSFIFVTNVQKVKAKEYYTLKVTKESVTYACLSPLSKTVIEHDKLNNEVTLNKQVMSNDYLDEFKRTLDSVVNDISRGNADVFTNRLRRNV